jgi:hypothetical protein
LLIHEFTHPVLFEGRLFRARASGLERADGTWTGWLEFQAYDLPSQVLATGEETSQPNRVAIEYWAGGLEPIYLEGALGRALDRRGVTAG